MVLDIITIGIILVFAWLGAKKGLVETLFATLSFILALVLTISTMETAVGYLKTTEFGENIYEKTKIEIVSNEDAERISEFAFLFPDIEKLNEDASMLQETVSEALGDAVLKSICGIGLFLCYGIILRLLSGLLGIIAKLPVISTFNKIGGIFAGFVKAWLFIIVISCLITFILPTESGKFLAEQLEASVLFKYFYINNPLI